jgi:hypothetical protein
MHQVTPAVRRLVDDAAAACARADLPPPLPGQGRGLGDGSCEWLATGPAHHQFLKDISAWLHLNSMRTEHL